MNPIKCIILLLTLSLPVFSQSNYFQQQTNYKISVRLNPETKTLRGFTSIEYTNHSPDTLSFIWFHLWPNAYKDNNTAFAKQKIASGSHKFHFFAPHERGFIDSLNFKINEQKVAIIEHPEYSDVVKLVLNQPLLPGSTQTIETPFYVKLPLACSRLGYEGESYQISQWYPKPAVYDQYGWHAMPYLDQGEFYSEFGTFNVDITVPSNYVVGASGNLLNGLETAWLDSLATRKTTPDSLPSPWKSSEKTLSYRIENTHDFAWFASPLYTVRTDTVTLKNSGKKIKTIALFNPRNTKKWENATSVLNDAVYKYSEWYMDYPWDVCTAVDGALSAGGAMEYPTITVVGPMSNPLMLEIAVMHEVGHNWFYGILGFNEREFPFLDEGLNTFSECRYMHWKYPSLKLSQVAGIGEKMTKLIGVSDFSYHLFYPTAYLTKARTNNDQPLNLHSEAYTSTNYGMMIYMKSSVVHQTLLNSIGEPAFNTLMQDFFKEWAFKHPHPNDYEQFIRTKCSNNTEWYFNDFLQSTKITDYGITAFKNGSVTIKNNKDIASPLWFSAYANGLLLADSTCEGYNGEKVFGLPNETDSVVLFDGSPSLDYNLKNNIAAVGADRRLSVSLLPIVEQPQRLQVGMLPVVGFNRYNGLMAGMHFTSPLLPAQLAEYEFSPVWGFKNNTLAGVASVRFNVTPREGFIKHVTIDINGKRFGTPMNYSYNSLKLLTTAVVATKQPANAPRTILFAGVARNTSLSDVLKLSSSPGYETNITGGITISKSNALTNKRLSIMFSGNNFTGRTDFEATFNHIITSGVKFNARFFTSAVLYREGNVLPAYLPHLSGGNGETDYNYNQLYLGRFESQNTRFNVYNNQFTRNMGGFAVYMPMAYTDKWLSTLNFDLKVKPIPGWIYVNNGFIQKHSLNNEIPMYNDNFDAFVTEFGWKLPIGPLTIYVPLYSDIYGWPDKKFYYNIRYSLDINKIIRIKDSIRNSIN